MTADPVVLDVAGYVATVSMRDEANQNRITDPVHAGFVGALRDAGADPGVRVVVLRGLPGIFCAGAPVERMLAGPAQRTGRVWAMVAALLDCPVPIVAAVEGHALGGGLLLALYCDLAVFSERSRYSANFLTFGFTPILGATHLLPARLGAALAAEMLYTGRSVTGRELAERGAGVGVVPHEEVLARARRLAVRTAQAPRDTLVRLKTRLAGELRGRAEEALAAEIPDHEATIGSDDARRRIRGLHGQRTSEEEGTG